MSVYSDYLRRKSQDAIRFGYSDEYPCIAENSKGKDLKSYEIAGNSVQQNKNLLPYPYNHSTRVQNGITFTVNNDGSIVANGTATSDAYQFLTSTDSTSAKYMKLPRGRYWLSGCPEGGSLDTYRLMAEPYNGSSWVSAARDTGSGVFMNTLSANYDHIVVTILIKSGTTVDNLVFKPMLMSLDDAENAIYYPWNANTKTVNGITFTDDRKGNVVINGTATTESYFSLTTNYTGAKSKYFLMGCPSGGSNTTYGLHINLRKTEEDSTVSYVRGFNDYGSGIVADSSQYDYTQCEIVIAARANVAITNAVFEPKLIDISYVSQVPSFDNIIPIKSVGTKTKNVLPYPFATTTSTINEISITDESNGTLVLNGTATAFTAIQVVNPTALNLTPGKYWFSGCATGGNSNNYYMYLAAEKRDSTGGSWQIIKDFTETGSGMVVDLSDLDYNGIYISIGVKNGATVNNLEFKPFVMSLDDADNIIPKVLWQNHSKLGIDIVNNRDGSLTLNGTCTSGFYLSAPPTAKYTFNIPKGKYYLSGVDGGSHTTFGQYFELFNFKDRPLTTLATNGMFIDTNNYDYNLWNVELWIAKDAVVDNLVWAPKLVSVDYEPPAMYKVPVVIRGSNEINFPYNNVSLLGGSYENNGITYTINTDGSIIANGTATSQSQLFLQTGATGLQLDFTKYHYFTGCPKGGNTTSGYFVEVLPYRSSTAGPFSSFRDIGSGVRTVLYNYPVNGIIIKIVIMSGCTVDNLVFKPMLVEGEVASTSFEPYHEPIIKNIWIKEPLRKIDTTIYDRLISTDTRGIFRNIGSQILDGSDSNEGWADGQTTSSSITENNVITTVPKDLIYGSTAPALVESGRFLNGQYNSATYEGYTSWTANSTALMYRKDEITPDEMKESLQSHPSEVISRLRISTTESVEIPKLPAFKGTTIYETDTEVAPSNMKIKYVRK